MVLSEYDIEILKDVPVGRNKYNPLLLNSKATNIINWDEKWMKIKNLVNAYLIFSLNTDMLRIITDKDKKNIIPFPVDIDEYGCIVQISSYVGYVQSNTGICTKPVVIKQIKNYNVDAISKYYIMFSDGVDEKIVADLEKSLELLNDPVIRSELMDI
jgi:hypothetical protein